MKLDRAGHLPPSLPGRGTGPVVGGEKPVISAAGAGLVVEGVVGEPGDHSPETSSDLDAALARRRARALAELKMTATHEAGHIVAAYLLGRDVASGDGATVTPSLVFYGQADTGHGVTSDDLVSAYLHAADGEPVPAELRARIEADVIVYLAGPVATAVAVDLGLLADPPPLPRPVVAQQERDQVLVTRHADATGETRTPSDFQGARTILEAASATMREADTWHAFLHARTENLVRTRRFQRASAALAAQLETRGTIDGAGCVELLQAALPLPDAAPKQTREEQKMARAKPPVDALGKPIDPTATYVAVTVFATGYTAVSLDTRLRGDNAMVAEFSEKFIREDEPGNVIASMRAARRGRAA